MDLLKLAGKLVKYCSQQEIKSWIDKNVIDAGGNCFFYSAVISLLFPGLKLIKGKHSKQFAEDSAHFYLEDEDGGIIDPTTNQYEAGKLYAIKEISALKNIDYIIKDPMFKSLDKEDQNKILDLYNQEG